ncbi:uncharacterized protein MKK02DRAFT_44556 [Dioszegia hungarica]|uniref:Uncharacterized protein n=1 Tax=Dioszegia hungarica TaxID=4972 RepID=A0AA38H7L8_9TREE|nr:uncharacterized protein MKK02DRAFT_44556 [Dioszegia hungarica]KAI9635860.1 hypothetical protein MKK02DRAFT_44556 [Dioszegia hungarica]
MRFTLLTISSLVGSVAARQPYHWLDIVGQFSKDILYPANAAIAASGTYSTFQPDIKGRIDISTALEGDELNVEYVFGLFAQSNASSAQLEPTSLIPTPVAGRLQSLAIQDNVVSLSNIVSFTFFKQNLSIPLQLDAWFVFDRKSGQMSQYDVTFRRWAWFWQEVMSLLMPDLEKENEVTPGRLTQEELLTLHAARRICSLHDTFCSDATLKQYNSTSQCLDFLTGNRTFGAAWALGQDTTGCRYMHTTLLKNRPAEHCPNIGPSGGKMCVVRNYTQVVTKQMYEHTFIAPASNSPESLEGISASSETELLKVGMLLVGPFAVGWFPSIAILYFFLLWLSAIVTRAILLRTSKAFVRLSWSQQRTCVVYVLSTVYTSVALGLQLAAFPTAWYSYSVSSVGCIRLAGVVITGLYIFEMIHREAIRLPLLIHHLLTIFAIVWVVFCLDQVQHPSLITTAEVWLFQATLEQVVFLGLLSYRLGWPTRFTKSCLGPGAMVSFVLKVGAAIWLLVIWGTKQRTYREPTDIAFSVILWFTIPCLLAAQAWGAWVCCQIAWSVDKKKRGGASSKRRAAENRSDDSLESQPHTASGTREQVALAQIPMPEGAGSFRLNVESFDTGR